MFDSGSPDVTTPCRTTAARCAAQVSRVSTDAADRAATEPGRIPRPARKMLKR